MKNIQIVIERSKDMFTAYSINMEGIYGAGDTVAEARASIEKSVRLYRRYNKEGKHPLQGDFRLVYQFDVSSMLNYYKGIFTNAALERLTGIHQKQLQHYASGLRKPRAAQKQKIAEAFQALGKELLSLELL
jgi:predicted RNase H-like HicB family nuclease